MNAQNGIPFFSQAAYLCFAYVRFRCLYFYVVSALIVDAPPSRNVSAPAFFFLFLSLVLRRPIILPPPRVLCPRTPVTRPSFVTPRSLLSLLLPHFLRRVSRILLTGLHFDASNARLQYDWIPITPPPRETPSPPLCPPQPPIQSHTAPLAPLLLASHSPPGSIIFLGFVLFA